MGMRMSVSERLKLVRRGTQKPWFLGAQRVSAVARSEADVFVLAPTFGFEVTT